MNIFAKLTYNATFFSVPKNRIMQGPSVLSKVAMFIVKTYVETMGVVPGGAGGAMAPQNFGRSVNPISTRRRSHYAPHIITCPPDFQTFLWPCYVCTFFDT